MNADLGTFLTGGALIGLLVGFWSKIKALAWRAANTLVVRVEFREELAAAVRDWLFVHGKQRLGGTRVYTSLNDYIRPLARWGLVPVRDLGGDALVFTVGRWPVIAKFGRDSRDTGNGPSSFSSGVVLLFVRRTFDPDFLAATAAGQRNQVANGGPNRWAVIRLAGVPRGPGYGGHGDSPTSVAKSAPPSVSSLRQPGLLVGYAPDDIGQPTPPDPFVGLVYPPEVEDASGELRRWLDSRAWYEARGIPWRRGWLLYGPPGCGKTRLVRALTHRFDLPVYVFDLATMGNQDLDNGWQSALSNIPAVALFEDIDAIFDGRENVAGEDSRVTFDKLLGVLSGVGNSDGLFVVVTTNRPERLDPALGAPDETGESTRPGRIDRVIRLGPPADADRRKIIAGITDAADPAEINRLTAETAGRSAAQVVETAARVALEKYWDGREAA